VAYGFSSTIGGTSAGFGWNKTSTAYNLTVYDCSYGFRANTSGVTLSLYNCLAQSCTDGFYVTAGATFTGSNNCSDIASDAPGTSPQTGTVSFVDAANGDFHLTSGDTVAKDNGTDLSGTFTTDIDGQTRTGTWDIGADEYVASGETTYSVPYYIGIFERP
jgi:hypothetical protein